MVAHPVPIYLGCAGLIVGTLGLGAHHMVGGNSVATTARVQPLFARSVEEAALPAPRWHHQNQQQQQQPGVAFHEPMVELLTTGASPEAAQAAAERAEPTTPQREAVRQIPVPPASQAPPREPAAAGEIAATASAPVKAPHVQAEAGVAARREVVRDVPRQQAEQPPKRTKNVRRAKSDSETSNQRSASERRPRAPEDRRQREPEQRVIVRELAREPEPRIVRAPESGFNPFRLFGIFDQH